MNLLLRLDCILKGIWRTIRTGQNVDGCVFVEMEKHENVTVSIIKCKYCGKQEICWRREE